MKMNFTQPTFAQHYDPQFPNFAVVDDGVSLADIGKLFSTISGTKGKAKQDVLMNYALHATNDQTQLLYKVLQYAYDARRTYGIGRSKLIELKCRHEHNIANAPLSPVTLFKALDAMADRSVSGNAMFGVVGALLESACDDVRWVIEGIMLKDLRCGITEESAHDLFPNLYELFRAHLAESYKASKVTWPRQVEPKLDGFRVLAIVSAHDNAVRFRSREGNDFTAFNHLKEPLLRFVKSAMVDVQIDAPQWAELSAETRRYVDTVMSGFLVLDCEVVSGDFKATAKSARKKNTDATDAKMVVFDILDGVEYHSAHRNHEFGLQMQERRAALEAFFKSLPGDLLGRFVMMPKATCNTHEEAWAFFKSMRERGIEGALLKDPSGRYAKNRTYDWVKLKDECDKDLIVVGGYLGEAGKAFENTLGGLVVINGYKHDKKSGVEQPVFVDVGGGYTIEQRAELLELLNQDLTEAGIPILSRKNSPAVTDFRMNMSRNSSHASRVLGRIARIEFHEETPDGSLRHPRFDIWRDTIKPGSKE